MRYPVRLIQQKLVKLADAEIVDALADLHDVVELHSDAQGALDQARGAIAAARGGWNRHPVSDALVCVRAADDALGSGMTFEIGEATLMF